MKSATSIFKTLFCCILFAQQVHAQPLEKMDAGKKTSDNDSLGKAQALNVALQFYHNYLQPETSLYRSTMYIDYAYLIKDGHPYFQQERMMAGTVVYRGILYRDLLMQYDLVKEVLILPVISNAYKLGLIKDQVDSFTLEDHRFIRLNDKNNASAPRSGYYEELYVGSITILKKEQKILEEDLSVPAEGVQRHIHHIVDYYLKKDNIYYHIGNKRSFCNAFKDQGKAVRQFIRKSDLDFRDDKENTLIKVSAWYDSLH